MHNILGADNSVGMFKPDVEERIRLFICSVCAVEIPYNDLKALKAEYLTLKRIIKKEFPKAIGKKVIREAIEPTYHSLKVKIEC